MKIIHYPHDQVLFITNALNRAIFLVVVTNTFTKAVCMYLFLILFVAMSNACHFNTCTNK